MEKTKKTADMKEYQKNYRKSHPKSKEENSEYMKKYIKNAEEITCKICGGHYKTYAKYKHDATNKHLKALLKIKENDELEIIKREIEKKEKEKEESKKKTKKKVSFNKKEKNALELLQQYNSDSGSDSEADSESDDEEEKKPIFKLTNKLIDSTKVIEFLDQHFIDSVNPNRSVATKTPRTNKNLSLWKKVSKIVDGKTWKYLGEHFIDIIHDAYDKPTSQADTISMLKLVINHFSPLSEKNKKRLDNLNRGLKNLHISKQTSLPENGLSYAELKDHENDENTIVALFARLYNGDIPALRIYDWINSFVGKTKDLNEIDLKKRIMIRRISKNQKIDEDNDKVKEVIIALHKDLIDFIKKRGISGPLLGDINAVKLDALLKKTFPGKTVNPRYFRAKYSTEIVPTFSKEKLEKTLEDLDHSSATHVAYYRKMPKDELTKILLGI